MEDQRRDPEALLKQVEEEERVRRHGKLKIYLGAAPGVGKTYMMLNDAIAEREKGLDVIIGVVETHGRQEIEYLVHDLEILPRQVVEYRGKQLTEFDLEGALKRHPALIIMDEMAHSNAPGLLHEKRWQDIKELLDRGIDVYTTLNVQHIESLNDVVSQIIHSRVHETVPDSMLEMADTMELVDLPPDDLLKRLKEGKVYVPEQARLATEHFFRKGNLIALRELALRVTAERVGAEVVMYRQGQGIKNIWATKEKILVCVGSGPQSIRLIRAARRLAMGLQVEWVAVHVDASKLNLTDEQRNTAIQNLNFAEQLGAETRIIPGIDMVSALMQFAREQNVTTIVIGKLIRSRFSNLFKRSLADELVRASQEIDVHIVTGDATDTSTVKPEPSRRHVPWRTYAMAAGLMALTSAVSFLIFPFVNQVTIIMLYLLSVAIVSVFGKMGPSIFASIFSVFLYGFLFVQPLYTFAISDLRYLITLIIMLIITQAISQVTLFARRQAESARLAEQRMAALHTLSRQLASTRGVDKLLETALQYISQEFDCKALALLPEEGGLVVKSLDKANVPLNDKEQGVARWVYELGQTAGLGTDTLPFSDALYVPLVTSQRAIGVLVVNPGKGERLFTPDQVRLLEAFASQIALALEVDRLQEQSTETALREQTDRARNSLLQVVSHDLRVPIVAAMGAAATIMEMSEELDKAKIKQLGKDMYVELDQLGRLINNLLQIIYLESESVKLQKKLSSLSDIIYSVVEASRTKIGKRMVSVHLPEHLPLVPFDPVLIHEVIVNLLDNAIKFTPLQSPIDITVRLGSDKVIVSVDDHGPGIVPDEVNRLFEKFYRGRKLTSERGLGLGLAICHSIIKAHGGNIWAENRPDGGAIFKFTLPIVAETNNA